MLVAMRRMEADLLATRALVHASITENNVKPAVKAYTEYADKLLPFLAKAGEDENKREREALLKFVKRPARISKKYIYQKQIERMQQRGVGMGSTPGAGATSKFKLRPRSPGL